MVQRASAHLFNRALGLLREGVAPAARVIPHGGTDAAVIVTLEESGGGTSRLQLVPWDALDVEDQRAANADPRVIRVWVAPRASAQQRQRWREHNENFIDLSGAIRLVLPNIIVDRTDIPTTRSVADTVSHTRNPFADRASLVVRTLLEHPGEPWGVTQLAETAGVSIPTVSLVAEGLREMGLLSPVSRRGAIVLDDPAAVIAQWARRYDWRQNTAIEFAAPVGSPARFLTRLPAVLGPPAIERVRVRASQRRWALTLQAGASLVDPHADWDIVHIYIDADSATDLIEIGARSGWPVSPGGRVVLMLPHYRTSVWYGASMIRTLPVVSRAQLVLDLWHYPVRGREQAEHLLRDVGLGAARTSRLR